MPDKVKIEKSPKIRGLGRGLSALIGDTLVATQTTPPAEQALQNSSESDFSGVVRYLGIDQLVANPNQPRRHFESQSLDELARSIKEKGVLQPIIARPLAGDGLLYEIVAGERRWRAAQRVRINEIPVIIKELTDREVLEIALIENIQRHNLNAIEEAQAFQKLIAEYGHTQAVLAKLLGKSRSHITNTLRLLRLSRWVQDQIVSGLLSAGHARALLASTLTGVDLDRLARKMIDQGLSVRAAEALVRVPNALRETPTNARIPDPDIVALSDDLSDTLGLKVMIYPGRGGGQKGEAGELRLYYQNLDDLDLLIARLRGRRG